MVSFSKLLFGWRVVSLALIPHLPISIKKGRNTADLPIDIHPYIVPVNHHVTTRPIKHYHAKSQNQSRTMTEGAISSAGSWTLVVKRKVRGFINNCVVCITLQRKVGGTQMAPLLIG